jgi:hypothetical protein
MVTAAMHPKKRLATSFGRNTPLPPSPLQGSDIIHQNNIGRHRIRRSLSGKRSFLLLEDGPGRDPHGPGGPKGDAVFAEE